MSALLLCALTFAGSPTDSTGDVGIGFGPSRFEAALRDPGPKFGSAFPSLRPPSVPANSREVAESPLRAPDLAGNGEGESGDEQSVLNPTEEPLASSWVAEPPQMTDSLIDPSQELIFRDGEVLNAEVPDLPPGEKHHLNAQQDRLAALFNPFVLFGQTEYSHVGILPYEPTHGKSGHLQITEFNSASRHARQLSPGLIFATSSAFNIHLWNGPSGVALPGAVFHIGYDFELTGRGDGPWSVQVGFTPQIASDFRRSLNSGGYNFDGRAIAFYRSSPELLFAFGAAYWNRVTNRVVPHVGLVWTPNERWDLQLLFPRSRISFRLRADEKVTRWLYASGEYNVESYQANIPDTRTKDRIELSDNRFLLGLSSQREKGSSFLEGGWVVNRHVRFLGTTPTFNIATGPLIRAGFRY